MSDDKLKKYHEAYATMQASRLALLDATRAAWPVGMQVVSNKFHTGPIDCTVAGHHKYGHDQGALTLRNNRTGKCHTAWPHFLHNGVYGVERDK